MTTPENATFWEHLDELRGCLIRILIVVTVAAGTAFCMKEELFGIVLAPRSASFVTYRMLGTEPFSVNLMNTGLTEQFFTHMKMALYAGLLAASPYVLYVLFRFISPALYASERRYASWITLSAYTMFAIGTLANYFIVFPLTLHFLGTYQVSPDVANMLTLQSYTDTFITMSLTIGVVFELPVVCWILARMGFISGSMMRHYRRHAVVAILIAAAVITPTTDIFTLFVVSLPVWLLYEASIVIITLTVNRTGARTHTQETTYNNEKTNQ